MRDYVMLTWDTSDLAAGAQAEAIAAPLASSWRLEAREPGLLLLVPLDQPPAVRILQGGRLVLIGDYWSGDVEQIRGDPSVASHQLSQGGWGRYAAIFRGAHGLAEAIYRDPSGGLDAIAWRRGGVGIVASDLLADLDHAAPRALAIDWAVVGAALCDRMHLAGATPLVGLTTITPGGLRKLGGDKAETLIWRPDRFARLALDDAVDRQVGLVAVIDSTIAALTGRRSTLAEVSGGLDSAIVASSLVRARTDVRAWLNYHVVDPHGDERTFARAVARQNGFVLTEAVKADAGVDLGGLEHGSPSARPSFRLVDAAYDQDLARRCRDLGVEQIVTGLGGDVVFMQGGSRWLGGDYLRHTPPWRWRPKALMEIARRAQTSVWRAARLGLAGAVGLGYPTSPPPRHLTAVAIAAARRRPPPLWRKALAGLTPTKRAQVEGLARVLLVTGRSARSSVADVVNPLLAQPVMEATLSLSSLTLTQGGDDRAFARAAFADRLPPLVRDRRSKGDLSRHYGQALARDLPQLRDLLLDGALAEAGLLRRDVVDAMLTPEHLIWSDPYRDIIGMVVMELWVRSWRSRLVRLGYGNI